MGRIQQPLDPEATRAANERLWAAHPELNRRPLTMEPEDAALRQEWANAYQQELARQPQQNPAPSNGGSGGGGGGGGPPGGNRLVGSPSNACPATTTADLAIRVTDQRDGSPIPGAKVEIQGPTNRTGTTDDSGSVIFQGVDTGAYTVTGSKRNYSTQSTIVNVTPGATTVGKLELLSETELSVTVQNKSNGDPISGATVTISGPQTATLTTDASGTVVFRGIDAGDYQVRASRSGFRSGTANATVIQGGSTAPVTIQLQAVGNLGGVVKDKDTSAGIPGATVTIKERPDLSATSDASGSFSFADLDDGTYNLTAKKNGFVDGTASGNVAIGTSTAVTIPMKAPKGELDLAGVAAAKKTTDGGLIVRNHDGNNAPRKEITIKKADPASFTGNILLQCASDKVKFFDAATGGTQITIDGAKNRFANAGLPKSVWVEGAKPSDTMRDIEVSLDIEGSKTKVDSIKLTVLWVDKPDVALAGTVSADNDKRDAYKNWTKAGTFDLGLQLYNANFGARMGWGSEARAKVHPKGFNYPGNDLKLERDFFFRDYQGTAEIARGDHRATVPPGNDTGPAAARDDNPAPNDMIYDWDAAGLNIPNRPKDTIMRTRNNFTSFASITVEGKAVRCSEIREYRIRFSQKQFTAPSGTDWRKLDPPDVAGDNEAGNGTTNVTWDLK